MVVCANQRCDQDNVIEQLENGVNARRVPLYDLVSNWAYMVIAALACTSQFSSSGHCFYLTDTHFPKISQEI